MPCSWPRPPNNLPWLLTCIAACLQDCQAAIDRDAKEAAAWFNKGNAEMRLGDFNSALTSYTYAADAAPGIAGYRLREAQLLFEVRSLHQPLPWRQAPQLRCATQVPAQHAAPGNAERPIQISFRLLVSIPQAVQVQPCRLFELGRLAIAQDLPDASAAVPWHVDFTHCVLVLPAFFDGHAHSAHVM